MNIIKLRKKLNKFYHKQTLQNLRGKFKKASKTEIKIINLLLRLRYKKDLSNG